MTKFGFDHFHLNSSNLEETIHFFEKLFSARVIKRWDGFIHKGMKLARLRVKGGYVHLYERPESEAKPRHESCSIDHVGYRVRDFDKFITQLKERGAKFTLEPTNLGEVKVAFIQGPDKLLIEIYETDIF